MKENQVSSAVVQVLVTNNTGLSFRRHQVKILSLREAEKQPQEFYLPPEKAQELAAYCEAQNNPGLFVVLPYLEELAAQEQAAEAAKALEEQQAADAKAAQAKADADKAAADKALKEQQDAATKAAQDKAAKEKEAAAAKAKTDAKADPKSSTKEKE